MLRHLLWLHTCLLQTQTSSSYLSGQLQEAPYCLKVEAHAWTSADFRHRTCSTSPSVLTLRALYFLLYLRTPSGYFRGATNAFQGLPRVVLVTGTLSVSPLFPPFQNLPSWPPFPLSFQGCLFYRCCAFSGSVPSGCERKEARR